MHEIDNILIISIIARLALVSPEYFFGCGYKNRGLSVRTHSENLLVVSVFQSKMISFLLMLAACEAKISAKVEFHADSSKHDIFHMIRIRNQRSLIASIGNQAELKFFTSGKSFARIISKQLDYPKVFRSQV